MFANLVKLALLVIVMVFTAVVVGGVTPTAADTPPLAPPTVVLPTPAVTRTPPRVTPDAQKAPVRVAATPTPKPAIPVKAPKGPAGSWITDFTLLNLAASQADVTLMRYPQCATGCSADSGTQVNISTSCGTNKICASGSAYYNPATDSSFPSGFSGSITVSSSQSLAGTVTMANTSTGTAYASDAYSAVTNPSTSIFAPIVMSGYSVWNTRITVQNAGASNTNVTIHYIGTNAPADSTISNLPSNMMAMVDQAGLATNFNGSATITSSSQNVAVVVEEYKTSGGVLLAYNGIPSTSAGTTVYLPGYIDQGAWATDLTIVNTTGTATTASVAFSGSSATLSGPLGANGMAYLNRYGSLPTGWSGTFPTSYYGAATITGGQNVVAAYNIANSGTGGAGNLQAAYLGFPTSGAGTTVVVPLIENMYSTGWVTTFSVQSIDGTAATLTLVYAATAGACNGSCTKSGIVMTGASQTFNQVTDGHVNTGFLGGVTITSNKNIVVIADQTNTTATSYQGGDSLAGFVGLK